LEKNELGKNKRRKLKEKRKKIRMKNRVKKIRKIKFYIKNNFFGEKKKRKRKERK
jgi:hypothetical protein